MHTESDDDVKTSNKVGPKYWVNIEGIEHPWNEDHISREQIAQLGGWDPSQGVLLIDKDNNETTLLPGQVVPIKPGEGFSKKVHFKRGDSLVATRIEDELALLRSRFNAEFIEAGQWVRVGNFKFPPGWGIEEGEVAFQIPIQYPASPPYGFYVRAGLRFNGSKPNSYQEPANNRPPFEGNWGFFSWAAQDGQWRATTSLSSGSNLLNVLISFGERLKEGV